MTTQHTSGSKATPTKIVTTSTGRIMRVRVDEAGAPIASNGPATQISSDSATRPRKFHNPRLIKNPKNR